MGVRVLLAIGAGLCALVAMPVLSQGSGDGSLEAACRATEVTSPQSCPCTITKARAVGVSDAELASLFRDDGHSQPVPPAKYSAFWQVKSQCIADAMMASLGVTPGNPLPGVPANMRPGMPFPGAAPAPVPAPAPTPAPAATRTAASGTCTSDYAGPEDIVICGDTGMLATQIVYNRALDDYPELLALLKAKAQESFRQASRGLTTRHRYAYIVGWHAPSVHGSLVSVGGSDGDTSRGRLSGASSVLWDTRKAREVQWSDVFESSAWNGPLREEYCDRLHAVRKENGESVARVQGDCPKLDELSAVLSRTDDGQTAVAFYGATYTVASYATGALYEGIAVPLDDTLLRGVKPAYRDALGAGPAATRAANSADTPAATSLQSRLGPIKSVLGGDIGATDDFYFLPAGRLPLETVAKFDRVLDQDKPTLFMTIHEGDGDNWGFSLILDGRQHDLMQTSHNADYSVRTYSDGVVTVRIATGETVSNNPAFGYSLDTITLSKGGESATFMAINFSGA
jgi:hypothetical protein